MQQPTTNNLLIVFIRILKLFKVNIYRRFNCMLTLQCTLYILELGINDLNYVIIIMLVILNPMTRVKEE